jgi:hypothetical protein
MTKPKGARRPQDIYRHLVAWCRMMGSHEDYTRKELGAAMRANAPEDVVFRDVEGNWKRFADVANPATRSVIERFIRDAEPSR